MSKCIYIPEVITADGRKEVLHILFPTPEDAMGFLSGLYVVKSEWVQGKEPKPFRIWTCYPPEGPVAELRVLEWEQSQ